MASTVSFQSHIMGVFRADDSLNSTTFRTANRITRNTDLHSLGGSRCLEVPSKRTRSNPGIPERWLGGRRQEMGFCMILRCIGLTIRPCKVCPSALPS